MHPMQPNINFYVFSYKCLMSIHLCIYAFFLTVKKLSYKSQCIYAMHASYADVYKLVYILFYEFMHHAMHTSYAALYKLVYIVFYESMAYACILRYN